MTKARVNGIELEYMVSGEGSAVLLSHGYADTGRAWDGQRQALSEYLITWDMRGHGETDSPHDPAQYSLALTVADMRALLQHVGVDRAVVGGLSLGGYVSLAFALAHPEMVRALMICDSGPGFRNADARAAWNTRAHDRATKLEARGLAALGSSRAAREIARQGATPAPGPA
jgi:pimeloyl-ACP methyl ester carboxylesterase